MHKPLIESSLVTKTFVIQSVNNRIVDIGQNPSQFFEILKPYKVSFKKLFWEFSLKDKFKYLRERIGWFLVKDRITRETKFNGYKTTIETETIHFDYTTFLDDICKLINIYCKKRNQTPTHLLIGIKDFYEITDILFRDTSSFSICSSLKDSLHYYFDLRVIVAHDLKGFFLFNINDENFSDFKRVS